MSTARAYYNEFDPYAAAWLRNLIAAGHIAPGDVDERSIEDVRPDDLKGYTQCHFFAGIGGWSLAARLAGWPDARPLWTGSCPCQPFSVAGKGEGQKDERHLWPVFFELIRSCRPDVVMGEQVAAAVGKDWLDGVFTDLEGIDYACGAAVVPACAVDAPHRRDRLWFVADADGGRQRGSSICTEQPRGAETISRSEIFRLPTSLAGTDQFSAGEERQQRSGQLRRSSGDTKNSPVGYADSARKNPHPAPGTSRRATGEPSGWASSEWLEGFDGKARRVEPGIRLLAHGVPARVGKLRAYGNAIVPQVAAEVIGAYIDSLEERFRLTGVSLLSPTEGVFS